MVTWTSVEEVALVDILYEYRSEAGDGGNFKKASFQRAVNELATKCPNATNPKDLKSIQNKWNAFRKIYKAILKIKEVSGWHWDDATGASITADTALSWDAYVKAHPEAKPFRNKGWVHLTKFAEIMPSSSAAGSNVFHPTATQPASSQITPDVPDSSQPSPDHDAHASDSSEDEDKTPPASVARKRAREPATPTKAKRVRKSQGAAAILDMSASITDFGSKITAMLAPPSTSSAVQVLNPTPIRLAHAVGRVQKDETWLSSAERVGFINLLRTNKYKPGEVNKSVIDTYMALEEDDVRKDFICDLLIEAGVMKAPGPAYDFGDLEF